MALAGAASIAFLVRSRIERGFGRQVEIRSQENPQRRKAHQAGPIGRDFHHTDEVQPQDGGGHEHDVRQGLRQGVDDPGKWAGHDAHEDSAYREQPYECH